MNLGTYIFQHAIFHLYASHGIMENETYTKKNKPHVDNAKHHIIKEKAGRGWKKVNICAEISSKTKKGIWGISETIIVNK